MSLVINHNMMAANAARTLNAHYGKLATSTNRLSTGLRINSAADDAAGLAIRELQRADIRTLQQGARNANDAVSLIQTADGALQIIDEKLIRMKELAEQAATGTYDSIQRLMIESEYQAMASEITRIANATDFNGIHLLNGNLSGAHDGSALKATGRLKVHFGTGNDSAEDYYYIEIGCVTAAALGLGNAAYVTPRKEQKEDVTYTYEQLRDAGAQAAFNTTYTKKYAEYYNPVYQKLIHGTPQQEPLDARKASIEADRIASRLATDFANEDKAMTAAVMDKVYNDEYMTPYLTAYEDALNQGMSLAEAQAAADAAATTAALAAVLETNKQVVASGVSALTDPSVAALPPKNREGVEALIEEGYTLAYDTAYQTIYNGLYADAVAEALANTSIAGVRRDEADPTPYDGMKLTSAQVLAIHAAVDAEASAKAATLASTVKGNLQGIWDVYDDKSGAIYGHYYDEALSLGYPASVAMQYAEDKASAEGWDAVEAALRSGAHFGNLRLDDADFASSVGVDVPTAFPTVEQLDSLLENTRQVVYDSVYQDVYERRYDAARAAALNDSAIVPNPSQELTQQQVNDIHAFADRGAKALAKSASDQVKAGLQAEYDHAHDLGDTTSSVYQYYYEQNIRQGMSEADARADALERGGRINGWNAVQAAITHANVDKDPFGLDDPMPDADDPAGLKGHKLAPKVFNDSDDQLDIHNAAGTTTTMSVTGFPYTGTANEVNKAYEVTGKEGVEFLDKVRATQSGRVPIIAEIKHPADTSGLADDFFTTLGTKSSDWLDNQHTLNGGEPAMVAASAAFVKKQEGEPDPPDPTPLLRPGGTIATQEAAQQAITAINDAITSKDKIRAHLGAVQNRLENTISNLNIQAENLQAAESRISDVDVATEMTEFVRQQILSQSAVAMLAQANSLPKMAMQLIGG